MNAPPVDPANAPAMLSEDDRASEGLDWARHALDRPALRIEPLAGDASFRRYFRLRDGREHWVLMDAPPGNEDLEPFIEVSGSLASGGIPVPAILAEDRIRGFLVLEDLGDRLLRDELSAEAPERWFPGLLDLLHRLAEDISADTLPPYDRPRLQQELELFPEWYLGRHKGIRLSCAQLDLWEDLATRLLVSAERQPRGFVHRDFHSCNLLVQPGGQLAVIDFQDAVHGPLSYDLASLLWDRYIPWPRARLEGWMEAFRARTLPEYPADQWVRAVDWMGLQRNLKILGIFARLNYRDGKAGYLELLPRFWGYVQDVLPRYPEFRDFHALLEELACAP
ncbi:MAG: phosphotransferase [Xanthomonadales bacterium]|nr:phosphotransferase [Xanthomonadales bacterium]